MSIGRIYGKDSLAFFVTVIDQETGDPLDLSGASLETTARGGSSSVAGTAEVSGATTAGLIACTYAANSFLNKPGRYVADVRVTIGTESQTVAALPFSVSASPSNT